MSEITLRDVTKEDLSVFFEEQLDQEANFMAAFTSKNPNDKDAFMKHWTTVLSDKGVRIQTIVLSDGQVAGHVARYIDPEFGKIEVTYWIGKKHWGKGIGTTALSIFLRSIERARPIYARVASDNKRSVRVLEKCGFRVISKQKSFANARHREVEELIMELNTPSDTSLA
ncbi:MAG: GNAT family N-acetyltransferase [Nitrososphaerota archaeon]|nr:GNAT family N-acetyltransferase [Nitrososphaerota archaeon]